MATNFDASIDLTTRLVPADISSVASVERVRSAVERLSGANWISVEWCGDVPGNPPWVRLYKRGESRPQSGGSWDELAELIKTTVLSALEGTGGR
jgi:hypothetical protein